jgi:hypothetical protein
LWWLDTLEATLTREWATAEEMSAALNTAGGQDRFLLAGLAARAEHQGITPTSAQVYGFKIAPILGGELSVSNIQVIDFVVSVNILGQLHGGVNTLLLAYLMYRSGLVPRLIAVVGLIGGPLIFASSAAVLFEISVRWPRSQARRHRLPG